jgi:hypothetical protein
MSTTLESRQRWWFASRKLEQSQNQNQNQFSLAADTVVPSCCEIACGSDCMATGSGITDAELTTLLGRLGMGWLWRLFAPSKRAKLTRSKPRPSWGRAVHSRPADAAHSRTSSPAVSANRTPLRLFAPGYLSRVAPGVLASELTYAALDVETTGLVVEFVSPSGVDHAALAAEDSVW